MKVFTCMCVCKEKKRKEKKREVVAPGIPKFSFISATPFSLLLVLP